MAQKEIVINIMPDGTVKSKTENIKGKTCLKYIKIIEQMASVRAIDSEFTSEYYESDTELRSAAKNHVEEENVQYVKGINYE